MMCPSPPEELQTHNPTSTSLSQRTRATHGQYTPCEAEGKLDRLRAKAGRPLLDVLLLHAMRLEEWQQPLDAHLDVVQRSRAAPGNGESISDCGRARVQATDLLGTPDRDLRCHLGRKLSRILETT